MISNIGIVGAGTMGTGIAQHIAQWGEKVNVYTRSPETRLKSKKTIEKSLDKLVEKGKLTYDRQRSILENISYVETIEELKECNFVIESITETFEVKQIVLRQLDSILDKEAIIVTNTSAISVTTLAATTKRPKKIAGLHFFNPAGVMKLVELIRGIETSDETVSKVKEFAIRIGKTPVEVKRDTPAFIVNRLLTVQMREAIKMVEEGIATFEDVDKAIKEGLRHPMGLFELCDHSGLDIVLNVLDYLNKELGDSYIAPITLKQKVAAGKLGVKTGEGWYKY